MSDPRELYLKASGMKPTSLSSVTAHAHKRIDALSRICEQLIVEADGPNRAKLLGELALIQGDTRG